MRVAAIAALRRMGDKSEWRTIQAEIDAHKRDLMEQRMARVKQRNDSREANTSNAEAGTARRELT
jgi:hypothetical protein